MGTHGRNEDVMGMTFEGVIKGSSVKRDPSDMEKLRGTHSCYPNQLRETSPRGVCM